MQPATTRYNASLGAEDRAICDLLAREIDRAHRPCHPAI
jgi:hypothetical protein